MTKSVRLTALSILLFASPARATVTHYVFGLTDSVRYQAVCGGQIVAVDCPPHGGVLRFAGSVASPVIVRPQPPPTSDVPEPPVKPTPPPHGCGAGAHLALGAWGLLWLRRRWHGDGAEPIVERRGLVFFPLDGTEVPCWPIGDDSAYENH